MEGGEVGGGEGDAEEYYYIKHCLNDLFIR